MLEYCCPIFQKRLYSQTHRGLQIAFTRFLKLNSLTLLEYAQKIQIPVEMKKCCFCERPAKITAKIINGKLEFSYSVRCGHDNCKGTNLNTQSKEYLMVVNNWTEDKAVEYLKDKAQKALTKKRKDGFFDDPGKNPYSKEFWLRKGLSEEEALNKLKVKARKGYITRKQSGFYDDPSKNPFSKAYWIKRGCSVEEANSHMFNRKEYWIKRGLTEEQAVEKISEYQGIRWLSRKNFDTAYCSLESLEFYEENLKPLFDKFCITDEVLYNDKEYHIYNPFPQIKNKRFFYDFTILKLKIIIEYHGERFHPNFKVLTEEQLKRWHTIDKSVDAWGKKEIDDLKEEAARRQGFRVFTFFSNDIKWDFTELENYIKEQLNREHINENAKSR